MSLRIHKIGDIIRETLQILGGEVLKGKSTFPRYCQHVDFTFLFLLPDYYQYKTTQNTKLNRIIYSWSVVVLDTVWKPTLIFYITVF